MIAFKLAGIVIITAFCSVLIKQLKGEYAVVVSISGVILVGGILCSDILKSLVGLSQELEKYGDFSSYVSVLYKVLGISYIAYIASEICKNTGEESLSKAMLMGCKLEILGLCVPMIKELINISDELL